MKENSQYSDKATGRVTRVWFPVRAVKGLFPLCHYMHTSSGAHLASYPMGTKSSFPRGKVARLWSWSLTSI